MLKMKVFYVLKDGHAIKGAATVLDFGLMKLLEVRS